MAQLLIPRRGDQRAEGPPTVKNTRPPTEDTVTDMVTGSEVANKDKVAVALTDVKVATTNSLYQRRFHRARTAFAKLVRRAERLADHQVTVSHRMAATASKSARAEIERANAVKFRLGAIGAWIPGLLVVVLLAFFFLFETPFSYSTFRFMLDVPTRLGLLDVVNLTDPAVLNNLTALALSGIMSTVVLCAVSFGAKNVATWLYRARGRDTDEGHLSYPRSQLEEHVPKKAGAAISLALILVVSFVLHAISDARFNGGLFGGAGAAASTLVLLATALPSVAFLVAVLSDNPKFVHTRMLHRAAVRQFCLRFWSLRRESRRRKRFSKRYLKFELMVDKVTELMRHATLAEDTEVLRAALAGKLHLDNLPTTGWDAAALTTDRRWAPTRNADVTLHDSPWGTPPVWARLQAQFALLYPPSGSVLLAEWESFHKDPAAYVPLNPLTHTAFRPFQAPISVQPATVPDTPDLPSDPPAGFTDLDPAAQPPISSRPESSPPPESRNP